MSHLLFYLALVERWGGLVASIGYQLRIKYGLTSDPSAEFQSRWAARAQDLIKRGVERENAGRLAAKEIFKDFGTRKYAGEADTIAELLEAIGRK